MLLGKSFVQVSYLVLQYCIVTNNGNLLCHIVVDVGAFERLLGPCMDIMKRNIEGYEQQLMELFGTSLDLSELRQWNWKVPRFSCIQLSTHRTIEPYMYIINMYLLFQLIAGM